MEELTEDDRRKVNDDGVSAWMVSAWNVVVVVAVSNRGVTKRSSRDSAMVNKWAEVLRRKVGREEKRREGEEGGGGEETARNDGCGQSLIMVPVQLEGRGTRREQESRQSTTSRRDYSSGSGSGRPAGGLAASGSQEHDQGCGHHELQYQRRVDE